ncbi:Cell division protein FtsA [Rickettsiales bacterium Ac37b]|nr:Cell division protein FtsA [Rickettsiales bacterium Ac37b]
MKTKEELIAILDIGSIKTVCFIGKVNIATGNIQIIGANSQCSAGFKAGLITDVREAAHNIALTIEGAEKLAGELIEKIVVSISSRKIFTSLINATIPIIHSKITEKDIERVIYQCLEQYSDKDSEIIHYFPISYTIDNQAGIKNPLDMYGKQLGCKLYIIAVPRSLVLNMASCMNQCKLDIENFIASPYASSISCLTPEELETGATLIDIGGSTTTITSFQDNNIIHIDTLPLGGIHITTDIAQGIGIATATAERLKTLYGTTLSTSFDENQMLEINQEPNHIELDNINYIRRGDLSNIIRPRVEEILELAHTRLYNKTASRKKVITGGTSQLEGFRELSTHILGSQIRLAMPKYIEGLNEHYKNPAFSTAIGMALFTAKQLHINAQKHFNQPKLNLIQKLLKWL